MLYASSSAAFYVEGGNLFVGFPSRGWEVAAKNVSHAYTTGGGVIAAEMRAIDEREVIFFRTPFGKSLEEMARISLSSDDLVISENKETYVLHKKPLRLRKLELDLDGWRFEDVPFEWSGDALPYRIITHYDGTPIGGWRVDRVEIKTPWARLTLDGAGFVQYVDGSVLVEVKNRTTVIPTINAQTYTTRVCRWQFVHDLKCNDWLVYDPRRGAIKQVAPHTGATRKGGVHDVGKSAVFFRNTPIVIAENGYAYDYTEGVAAKRRLLHVPRPYRHEVFFDYGASPYAWDIAYVKDNVLYTMRRGEVWRAPEGREIGQWCVGEYGGFAAIMHYTPTLVVKDMCLTAQADRQYELVAL
jgi:hypothetical protein